MSEKKRYGASHALTRRQLDLSKIDRTDLIGMAERCVTDAIDEGVREDGHWPADFDLAISYEYVKFEWAPLPEDGDRLVACEPERYWVTEDEDWDIMIVRGEAWPTE